MLGSLVVEIETEDGVVGVATGSGGAPAAWLIHHHFARFLVGEDARNINLIWDEMYRASLPYGRKGMPIMAISAVDLALWDLSARSATEPVYNLIGGLTRDEITSLLHRPACRRDQVAGLLGRQGAAAACHRSTGETGCAENVEFLKAQREASGRTFPLMVDCYMSLNVRYAIELAEACKPLNINWWEEVLPPDDVEGYPPDPAGAPDAQMDDGRARIFALWLPPSHRGTDARYPAARRDVGRRVHRTAAHRGARLGLRPAGRPARERALFLSLHRQPDGPAFCEYVAASPDGRSIQPVFGELFEGEALPVKGKIGLGDAPGFGMELASRDALVPAS